MRVLRKMRAVAGLLLLSPGLGMADDSAAGIAGPQAAPVQSVPEAQQAMRAMQAMQAMQAWPQMMPMSGAPAYYWAPPPGMMWPMPPAYPAPMALPSAPPVNWMSFVWVLVPVPAEMPGVADVSSGPAANAPVVKPPSLNAASAPTPTENAAPATSTGEAGNVNPSSVVGTVGAALPLADPLSAGGLSEPVSVPVVPPVDEKTVTPAVVVKPPLPDAVIPAVAVEAGKAVQAASLAGEAVPPPGLAASPAALLAAPTVFAVGAVTPDYGPVAPTPVVDLLALMQPVSPPARVSAKRKAVRKSSAAIPLKPRPAVTVKQVKPRMCWTKGVVGPCR